LVEDPPEQRLKLSSRGPEAEQFHAAISNENDYGQEDETQRDEPGLEKPPVLALESHNLGTTGKIKSPAPGRLESSFISKDVVRLITQQYLPKSAQDALLKEVRKVLEPAGRQTAANNGNGKAKAELAIYRHEILPAGYLRIDLMPGAAKSNGTKTSTSQTTSGGKRKKAASILYSRTRALEITNRWYLGDEPSVQPAFAGTNPRVGGPGTHRVQGLNQKLRDGSVYVHNGEFFQAAEDLHIPGKVIDLTFRRTYLSHSLFTSSLGRNWDWMGNMRLVEMLNGDVYLMNGEAGIEKYTRRAYWGKAVVPDYIDHCVQKGKFDYAQVYSRSQYSFPAGAYRSLVKAGPVEMDGMPAGEAGAEEARFYLVGKHGTIWTFLEDTRFETKADLSYDLEEFDVPNEHETLPGVHAHYLLVCIHDRRQGNYIKLQRDSAGHVRGVIDDYGRVTTLSHTAASASADRFVSSIKDFAGREITPTHKDRNLEAVKGPRVTMEAGGKPHEPEKTQFTYKYTEKASNGPRYRLSSVSDPVSASGGKYLIHVPDTCWDEKGRVARQYISGCWSGWYDWRWESKDKVQYE
jgi:hypothetical protein